MIIPLVMKDVMITALKEAGKIQLEYFNKVHRVDEKESISSIVTEVDLLCDKQIQGIIKKVFPDHNLLTEESGLIDKGSDYTWIVDPLDGTSNYTAGLPWFGVLIALFEGIRPVLGGAYLPVTKQIFIAEEGKGAFLNGKQLQMDEVNLKNSLFAFSTDYTTDSEFQENGMKLFSYLLGHVRNIRSTNSLVDHLMVAEGKFGGAVNLYTHIWDIAAPYLIIKEAGGDMRLLNGEELLFNLSDSGFNINYPVIAGTFNIVGEIRPVLTRIFDE
jgi:myo-inositol-1(or 4)-monophosphatase